MTMSVLSNLGERLLLHMETGPVCISRMSEVEELVGFREKWGSIEVSISENVEVVVDAVEEAE
jgi:hypothetical protein